MLDYLVAAFVSEEMEENPTAATQLGLPGHDHRLGEFSAADFERRATNEDRWLERFRDLDDAELSAEERIDRDLVVSALRGRRLVRPWAAWRRDPSVYLDPCLWGPFRLFLHRLHPEPDLVEWAAARLRQVPRVLEQARENLEPDLTSPVFVARAKGACRAGVAYTRDLIAGEASDGAARARLGEAGEVAAGALEGFGAYLEELGAAAAGPYAIGEELYSALLREKEGLAYGAGELRQRGQAAYDGIAAEMDELARRIEGPGGGGWRPLLERLNADHPTSPEAMRDAYADWSAKARRFLHRTGIVSMPEGEVCRVTPSPPFLRPVLAVASYVAPPAFQPSATGTFFVPFPPEGTPADEVQKRLETNSHHSIPTVAVHEAYPGHHWHLTTVGLRGRPIRKVLGTPFFSEGWALYAERLMREHGFFADLRHELCHLDARLFRAARMVVDTSLHLGDMGFDEAVTFMTTRASLSEPTARAEVARYCARPTQAVSYLTGALEIERIRERYLASGRGDLRRFNDTIAASGMLPVALAERAVLGPD
ncbi:MAG TPA: DUF885 domain-containing protein [Acidimicrobiales bacterium]|nr:DUF885 domain-containing protein [Acidimicrobiales bacterium]